MKITNIRVKNNYKVKLTNSKLAGVNAGISVVAEQGTRTPVIPTPPTPSKTFQEKYDIVMKYLIERYEPGWSAGDVSVGKAATMALLGISAGINPLILGGTAESTFNVLTSSDSGWFDPLTHPKDFAAAVKSAYRVFERARKPAKAKHRFVDYSVNGIGDYAYTRSAGNMFFNMNKNSLWYPETNAYWYGHLGLSADYENGIERHLLHSPYGIFRSPMFEPNAYYHKQSLPWMTDRYAPDAGWVFDQYLKIQESTTMRDMLTDCAVVRDPLLGVIVDGVTDTYLNTLYRGMSYGDGVYSKTLGNRAAGGFSAGQVAVGSPWISYPNGLTWVGSLADFNTAGLCFNRQTLVMFDGTTFPTNPPVITDRPVDLTQGLSWGNGETRIHHLNLLADAWGNSMEFIFYTGLLPYGPSYEQAVPWMMYKDPTDPENVRYWKWRMDASLSHWKEKFKSPIDGVAHIITDSASAIERTYHRYQSPSYTTWANVLPSGVSYVENIPVSWFRDQFNRTYGASGGSGGVVAGVELFAWYDWSAYPAETWQKKSSTDSTPKTWILDEDIAAAQYSSIYDLVVGQRFNGYTLTNQIWGMGVCGSSTLGEIFTTTRIADMRTPDGYPFYYNAFIKLNGNTLEWKGVPNTSYMETAENIPWYHDRRFTLFYHYPLVLALGGSILDHIHNGFGYYYASQSRWFDINLGTIYTGDMESRNIGPVVSNLPYPNRRTPTTPPRNQWTGNARTSEFELLYACMKGGLTAGLDSLGFTNLYNELDNAGTTTTPREGYYRALDYEVYGVSYLGYTGDNPAIVPMIKPEGTLVYYRGDVNPGSTAGMPTDQFADFVSRAASIPLERRVFLPTYWLVDGPSTFRPNDYFFKKTADGTTYTGNTPGVTYLSIEYGGAFTNLDTNPLRFNTPWAYVNRETAKTSYKKFLQQAKDVGQVFNIVNDDTEALGQFQIGSPYNTLTAGTAALDAYAVGDFSFLEIPDARRFGAIVDDPRFVGITNSVTNRTLAQEFKHHYDSILVSEGMGVCGASAADILTFFTNVNNRNDFKAPWGIIEQVLKMYAWNAAIYTFCHGDLKTQIIGKSLDETPGFENTKKFSTDLFAMNAAEAKFATDLYGHRKVQEHITDYGHLVHSYGQLLGGKNALGIDPSNGAGPINLYGYPPGATTDEATRYGKSFGWHPVSEGGITFGCSAYQAFISDIRRIRGILRTRPQAYQDGIRVFIPGTLTGAFEGWSGDVPQSQFYEGNSYATEYYKEHFYHLCLNGVETFNIFNPNGPVSLPNQLLIDWKVISGNTVGIPCTNATGATGATIDRIDLYQAGTNQVISGAYIGNTAERLWRITVPPGKNQLVRGSTAQSNIPETIRIPSGSRGVWLTAPASYGMPDYSSE